MGTVGLDSAYAPTLAQAQLAKAHGVDWWGLYVCGSAALNIWTPAEAAVLRQAGISPLPICVPDQAETENPTTVAIDFVAACKERGILAGAGVLDFEHSAASAAGPSFWSSWSAIVKAAGFVAVPYNGPHWTWLGSPQWDPLPSPRLPTPAKGQAIQWAGTNVDGLAVDESIADPGFPVGSWSVPDPSPQPLEDGMITLVQFGAAGSPGAGLGILFDDHTKRALSSPWVAVAGTTLPPVVELSVADWETIPDAPTTPGVTLTVDPNPVQLAVTAEPLELTVTAPPVQLGVTIVT